MNEAIAPDSAEESEVLLVRSRLAAFLPPVLLLVILAGGWLLRSTFVGWLDARSELQDVRKDATETLKVRDTLNTLLADFQTRRESVRRAGLAVPLRGDVPTLLAELEQLAKQSGLLVTSLQVLEAVDKKSGSARNRTSSDQTKTGESAGGLTGVAELTVNLTMRGAFVGFRNFLQLTEDSLRLLDVKSAAFSRSRNESGGGTGGAENEAPSAEFKVSLTAYAPQLPTGEIVSLPFGTQLPSDVLNDPAFRVLREFPQLRPPTADELGPESPFGS